MPRSTSIQNQKQYWLDCLNIYFRQYQPEATLNPTQNPMSSKTSSWPLLLIAFAMVGAGVSYHFTLDARFAALDQKLEQNSIALQQFQIAQESAASSKNAALDGLNKEVDALQASLTPLGKATKDQTDCPLAQIRQQIATLGQLQQAQQGRARRSSPTTPASWTRSSTTCRCTRRRLPLHRPPASRAAHGPAACECDSPGRACSRDRTSTVASSFLRTHASTVDIKPSVTPLTETSSVDLRPAEITAPRINAVRALPVALPVDTALSDNR